jgi:DNA gyrase subunit A
MGVIRKNEDKLFTLSENGHGKMTKLSEYPLQKRGGTGVFTFRVTPKTGKVVAARVLDHPNAEIVVISEKSKVIRSSIKAIPTLGRQTSGVKVMNLNKGDKVATMALL